MKDTAPKIFIRFAGEDEQLLQQLRQKIAEVNLARAKQGEAPLSMNEYLRELIRREVSRGKK